MRRPSNLVEISCRVGCLRKSTRLAVTEVRSSRPVRGNCTVSCRDSYVNENVKSPGSVALACPLYNTNDQNNAQLQAVDESTLPVCVDPCSSMSCGHGTCTVEGTTASCTCADGYTGDRCEIDPCTGYDCSGHGTCHDNRQCSCHPKWSGSDCSKQCCTAYGIGTEETTSCLACGGQPCKQAPMHTACGPAHHGCSTCVVCKPGVSSYNCGIDCDYRC